MRFLFVGSGFPGVVGVPFGSGIGTYLREVTSGLTARGHSCDVLVWGEPGAPSPQVVEGVRVHLVSRRHWPVVERWAPDLRNVGIRAAAAARLDAANPYDWIELQSDEGIDIGIQEKLPDKVILRVHTTLSQMVRFKGIPVQGPTRRWLARERRSLGLARRIVTHSESHADAIAGEFRLVTRPVVVHHGCGMPLASPPEPELGPVPRFLVVGSPDLRKGFDRLRPVIDAYSRRHGPSCWVIVARCPEAERSRFGLAPPLPEGTQIIWREGLSVDELRNEFHLATALVQLSRYESFGYMVIEAANLGLPVVATPAGIAPDVLSGDLSALIVEGDDPLDCARALTEARTRRDVLSRLLIAAHRDRFTRDRMAASYLEAIGRWSSERDHRSVPDSRADEFRGNRSPVEVGGDR